MSGLRCDASTGEISPTPRIRTGANAFGSPTVVGETLYFGNLDGHLYAHDLKSGDLEWAFEVPEAQVLDFVHAGASPGPENSTNPGSTAHSSAAHSRRFAPYSITFGET